MGKNKLTIRRLGFLPKFIEKKENNINNIAYKFVKEIYKVMKYMCYILVKLDRFVCITKQF